MTHVTVTSDLGSTVRSGPDSLTAQGPGFVTLLVILVLNREKVSFNSHILTLDTVKICLIISTPPLRAVSGPVRVRV